MIGYPCLDHLVWSAVHPQRPIYGRAVSADDWTMTHALTESVQVSADLAGRLTTATAGLSRRLGRAPTATEVAAELGMDRQDVVDGLVGPAPSTEFGRHDVPSATTPLAPMAPSLVELTNPETLRPLLAALPEPERAVLIMRLFAAMTHSEIAARVGLSPMRVAHLLSSALTRLRDQT